MPHIIRLASTWALAALLVGAPALACTTDPECDDGLVCTGTETCDTGTETCVPGTPVTCPPPGQCDQSVACEEPSGSCVVTPKPNGIICDDGFACSFGDTCQGGVCTAGPGDDSDGDGDCDADEISCGCDASDGNEVCVLPNRLVGRAGNRGGEVLMQWFAPLSRRVDMATDPSCATAGVCTDGYCTAGQVRDVCTVDADCDQPVDTCRLVLNWADVPDVTLVFADTLLGDVPGFTPIGVGCSRKVDVSPIDPDRRQVRLRLLSQGTVDGRIRRDRDVFRFRR